MTVVNNVEDANLLAKYLCDPGLSVQEAMRLYRAELRSRKVRRPLPAALQQFPEEEDNSVRRKLDRKRAT